MKYCEGVPRIVSDDEKQVFVAEDKLECLYLAITFQSNLTFVVAPGAYPRRKHLKGPPIGFYLALPSNS